jgi:hypothetical protein
MNRLQGFEEELHPLSFVHGIQSHRELASFVFSQRLGDASVVLVSHRVARFRFRLVVMTTCCAKDFAKSMTSRLGTQATIHPVYGAYQARRD